VSTKTQVGTVLSSAGLIALFSLISRVLGLLRDRLLAGTFGAGTDLDAYYAAFKLPDLLYNLLVLGALTAAFVPVVAGLLVKRNVKEANKTTSAVLILMSLLMTMLAVGTFIFARPLMRLAAPGFEGETFELSIQLTRIMVLSPIIFGISSVVSSYLNTVRRFMAYALAPVAYNVGIIIGILLLVPRMGVPGLAIGVVLGALLHVLVQLPALFRAGFRLHLQAPWRSPTVKRILTLAGPRVLSIAAMQINIVITTALATTLVPGTVSAYNLAFNLQSLPLGIVGVSLATAVFPFLAEAASRNNAADFVNHLSHTLRQMIVLVVPLSLFLIILRVEVVRLTLGSGDFDFQDTFTTSIFLGMFALSLLPQSAVPVLARGFYSLEDTRTPVIISLVSVVLNVVGAFVLPKYIGPVGLVLAFTGAAVVDFVLHIVVLRNRVNGLDDRALFTTMLRTLFATLLAGVVVVVTREAFEHWLVIDTFMDVLIEVLVAGLAGALVYIGLHVLLKSPELRDMLSIFSSKFHQRKHLT
jgi:putative peptidoglycan lipid II flippase